VNVSVRIQQNNLLAKSNVRGIPNCVALFNFLSIQNLLEHHILGITLFSYDHFDVALAPHSREGHIQLTMREALAASSRHIPKHEANTIECLS
jgi:hypothetical protein